MIAMSTRCLVAESGGDLSNNRLIKFIERKGVSANVNFTWMLPKRTGSQNWLSGPAVVNLRASYFFLSGYLEGVQSAVNQLVRKGLPFLNSPLFGKSRQNGLIR